MGGDANSASAATELKAAVDLAPVNKATSDILRILADVPGADPTLAIEARVRASNLEAEYASQQKSAQHTTTGEAAFKALQAVQDGTPVTS